MTVPDVRHVVIRVEETLAGLVEQVLHPSAQDLYRLAIADAQVAPEALAAPGQRLASARCPAMEQRFRQPENQVRVRREDLADVDLAGPADALKMTTQSQQIGDHLEMQVRHPSAVDVAGADGRERFARGEGPSLVQPVQRFAREVTVKREEFVTLWRQVLENDHRTVVERLPVVRPGVNDARQRCTHSRSGGPEHIEPEMNRPPLVTDQWTLERSRRVESPSLEVAADRKRRSGFTDVMRHLRGGHVQVPAARVERHEWTPDAEIQ